MPRRHGATSPRMSISWCCDTRSRCSRAALAGRRFADGTGYCSPQRAGCSRGSEKGVRGRPPNLAPMDPELVWRKWTYCRRGSGRVPLGRDTVRLIVRLPKENPQWGLPQGPNVPFRPPRCGTWKTRIDGGNLAAIVAQFSASASPVRTKLTCPSVNARTMELLFSFEASTSSYSGHRTQEIYRSWTRSERFA